MDCHKITSRADLEAACARAAAMEMPHLPMIRAAADGLVAMVLIHDSDGNFPSRTVESCQRPVIALIGADMGADTDPPPEQWRCLKRLRRWTRAAIIHGAGGEAEHYRAAVTAALLYRRLALIECTGQTARSWAEALRCPRTGLILPRDGVHPATPAPERMQ